MTTTREEALRALIEDHQETARLMREGGGHLHALTHDAFVIGLRNALAMPALPTALIETLRERASSGCWGRDRKPAEANCRERFGDDPMAYCDIGRGKMSPGQKSRGALQVVD